MAQQTKAINLNKFEAGDRPTEQDFIDLFDSLLFFNNKGVHDNGLNSNNTSILGNLDIGGSLNLLGAGSILISGSFSAGNPTEALGGRINAFTDSSTNLPGFYASSSSNPVLFQGISEATSATIMLSSDNDVNSFVKYGITNGGGFLDAQGTTVISYSTGSGASPANKLVHMDAHVGIGTASPGQKLEVKDATNDVSIQVHTDKTDGEAFVRFLNDALHWRLGVTSTDAFTLFDNTNSLTPFIVEAGAGTNTLVVDSNSRIGIGLDSPSQLFHVKGGNILLEHSVNPTLTIDHTDSGQIQFGITNSTAEAFILSTTNDAAREADIKFLTNDGTTEKEIVRFKEDGKVGIGIDAPASTLHVIGDTKLVPDSTADNFITFTSVNSTQTNQHFYVDGLATWQLYSSDENFHIRRASGNPGTETGGVSENYVQFRGGNATTTLDKGVEFFVPVTGSFTGSFTGDGSQLINITGGQITGFVTTPGDNRLVTSNATGDGVIGESNLTFGGTDLTFGAAATTANIIFPTVVDTGGTFPIRNTALRFPGTDDRAFIDYGFTADDAFELRMVFQDGNADRFKIISDSTNTYTALDINGNRALFFQDNSSGKVGIGTTSPRATLGIEFDGGHTTGAPLIANSILDLFNPLEANTDEKGSILTFSSTFETSTPGTFGKTTRAAIKGGTDTAGNNADGFLAFYTGEGATADGMDEHMRIDKDGNIGIGTNAPTAPLSVRGEIVIRNAADNGDAMTLFNTNDKATGPDIEFEGDALIVAQDALHLMINGDTGTDGLVISTGQDKIDGSETTLVTIRNNGDTTFAKDVGVGDSSVDPEVPLHVKDSSNEMIRLESDSATGDPFLSFFQTTTRRSFIQHADTDDKLRIVSEYGDIAFEAASTAGSDSNTEYMRIKAGGNVGIGTTNPRALLGIEFNGGHTTGTVGIANSSLDLFNPLETTFSNVPAGAEKGSILTFSDTFETSTAGTYGKTTRAAIKGGTDSQTSITNGNTADGFLAFYTDEAASNTMPERMRINHEGKVGIGTTTPSYNLHIADTNDASIYLEADTDDNSGGENHNAFLKLSHDNSGLVSYFGTVGEAGDDPEAASATSGTTDNSLYIGNKTDNDLHLITNDVARLTIKGDGTIEFPSNLDIGGKLSVANGSPAGTLHPAYGGVTMDVDATDGKVGCDQLHWNPDGKAGGNGSDYSWRALQGGFGISTQSRLGFQSSVDGVGSGNTAYIKSNQSGNLNFTGQHPCKPYRNLTIYQNKIGHIVISKGTISNSPENWINEETSQYETDNLNTPTIDESLPVVDLSDQPNDKKVFGVISSVDNPNDSGRKRSSFAGGFDWHTANRLDDRLIINSLGEGAIMVCNINGNLENGDYITTSHIEGLGMKQDDDLLHNYTVAKITQDCDFASGTTNVTHNGVTYQTKLVGCTYHCG